MHWELPVWPIEPTEIPKNNGYHKLRQGLRDRDIVGRCRRHFIAPWDWIQM